MPPVLAPIEEVPPADSSDLVDGDPSRWDGGSGRPGWLTGSSQRWTRTSDPRSENPRPLVTAQTREDNALAASHHLGPNRTPLPQPAPTPKPPPPEPEGSAPSPSHPSRWAALLARIYEVLPLICPSCGTALTFIAFLTDPVPIGQILAHIGEPTSPLLLHPARGPPQVEFDLDGSEREDVAQGLPPDDLDQTHEFDPADPEPAPEQHFDQSWGW
jgi:hypothetical protein